MFSNRTIQFRPHHFLCAVGFAGKGYSNAFIKNFEQIVCKLNSPEGDSIQIQVVKDTDNICSPCPHKQGNTCVDQEKITQLDNAHATALEIQPDNILTWGEAKKRIRKNISMPLFEQICAPCNWKKLGICQKALKELKESFITTSHL